MVGFEVDAHVPEVLQFFALQEEAIEDEHCIGRKAVGEFMDWSVGWLVECRGPHTRTAVGEGPEEFVDEDIELV